MKAWYLLQEVLGTEQDSSYPHDQTKRIPHIVRIYISDEVPEGAIRVANIDPVEAETFLDALAKFGIKPRHQRVA